MTQLLELELFQFFAIKHQVVKLADQGRVLVVGANGAGKTALLIEGPYYALFGRSFEYGERPGDAVGNRFHKSFMTRIDFEADGKIVLNVACCFGIVSQFHMVVVTVFFGRNAQAQVPLQALDKLAPSPHCPSVFLPNTGLANPVPNSGLTPCWG